VAALSKASPNQTSKGQQQQLSGSQLSQQLGRQAVQQHMKPKQADAAKSGGISVKSIYNESLIGSSGGGGSQNRGGASAGLSPSGIGQSPYQGWQSKNHQQQQQLLKQARNEPVAAPPPSTAGSTFSPLNQTSQLFQQYETGGQYGQYLQQQLAAQSAQGFVGETTADLTANFIQNMFNPTSTSDFLNYANGKK